MRTKQAGQNIQQESEQPVISKRTKYDEMHIYNTRCWWPCPCGGTIPDAPPHCKWAKRRGKKNSDRCVDIIVCVRTCPDSKECEALQKARKIHKERHRKDVAETERRQGGRKDED